MSADDLLWHSFAITHVMDCIADPTKNRVVAELSDDISPVFPYLNAEMPALMYIPGANTITLKREARILTFYPRVGMMAKVDGEHDAVAQLQWFMDCCNSTWRRRTSITPLYQRRKLLGHLDVYRLLPKQNCGDCGEATCIAFAVGLLAGRRRLAECPRLQDEQFAEGARRLGELLAT
jgi:ArsR family metal-binding transcriptional regulator